MPTLDLLIERVIGFIPVLLSLTVHEWAHAWTAWKLGDDTAKMLGRVSLNPMDHIDPVGTLLLPLLGIPFGWAKPVPFNPNRFHQNISMPMGTLLVASAGPISNLVLASIAFATATVLARIANSLSLHGIDVETLAAILQFLERLVIINALLALFNLLPIPPLDGSQIADAIMPQFMRPLWTSFRSLGPITLLAVIVLPLLLGVDLLAWPIHWISEMLATH